MNVWLEAKVVVIIFIEVVVIILLYINIIHMNNFFSTF